MIIGELVAILRADETELEEGVDRAERRMERMGAAAGVAGAAAGAALGAALTSAMTNAVNLDAANAKLEAQLGGAGPVSERAGQVAGELYAGAYGESMGEVNEAVRSVMTGVAGMADASADDLQTVTARTMSLAQAFDQDVAGATRAVDQMIRTGLAPNAEAALDILARGFQTGVNEADDLLDTMSEYSTVLRDVGLTGDVAMGLMSQGLAAGARDADTVADALKEFAIIAQSGSDAAAEGFAAIGLNAEEMTAAVAAGGPGAAAALDQVLDRLRGMEDPVARNAAAVALFGTKAEDLGDALFGLDPTSAVAALGQVEGAAANLDATIGDTAANRVTSMQRAWEQWSAGLIATEGPLGTAAAGVAAFGPAGIAMAGSLSMIGMAVGPLLVRLPALAMAVLTTSANVVAAFGRMALGATLAIGRVLLSVALWAVQTAVQGAIAVASMTATAARYVAVWVLMGVQAMARAAIMAAAWLVAMGPVGWVIAAVVGLVALIIANWDTVKNFTINAWNAVVGFIVGAGRNIANTVTSAVTNAKNFLVGGFNGIVGFVTGIPGRFLSALGNLGGLLLNSGRALVDGFLRGVRGAWDSVVRFVQQGMQWLRDLWPFSPAKKGPFSGRGYVTHSGKALTGDFAKSLDAGIPGIVDSARGVMAAAQGALKPSPDMRPNGLPGNAWLSREGMPVPSREVTVNVEINNPKAEKGSDSFAREMADLSTMGAFDL